MFERGIRQALTLFPSPSSPLSWLSIGFSLFSLPPLPPSVGSLSGSHSFPSPSSPFSWLSIGFLSFAQLGLYHPGSQEQEGWAWAGFGDAVEAMGLDTFVRVSGVGLDTFVRVSGGNGARHFCAGEWVSVWDGFTAGEHTHTVHTFPPPQGALCNSREEDLRGSSSWIAVTRRGRVLPPCTSTLFTLPSPRVPCATHVRRICGSSSWIAVTRRGRVPSCRRRG